VQRVINSGYMECTLYFSVLSFSYRVYNVNKENIRSVDCDFVPNRYMWVSSDPSLGGKWPLN